MLDALPVDPARVHEIPSTADADDVEAAAAAYADTIRSMDSGRFDLLMLGVGPDGHIASLFPGFPQLDLDDSIAAGVTGSPKPPPERVTLTYPALARSEQVWFVVSGGDKAEAVGRALAARPPDLHEIPAVGVHGQVGTIWFLDRDAAPRCPHSVVEEVALRPSKPPSGPQAPSPGFETAAPQPARLIPSLRSSGSSACVPQKMISPDFRRLRSSWIASSRIDSASASERRSFT